MDLMYTHHCHEHVYSLEGRGDRQTDRQTNKQTNNANTINNTKDMPKNE